MTPIDLVAAVAVLAFSVSLGLVSHEFAHATVLRAAGVPHDIEWFGGRDRSGRLRAGVAGRWATVRPRPSGDTPAWILRVSAMMPLAMVAPLAVVPAGVAADPFAAGGVHLQVALVGWMACALPSPQDFSVFWHADRAMNASSGAGEA